MKANSAALDFGSTLFEPFFYVNSCVFWVYPLKKKKVIGQDGRDPFGEGQNRAVAFVPFVSSIVT